MQFQCPSHVNALAIRSLRINFKCKISFRSFTHGWVGDAWFCPCFILNAAVLKSNMKISVNNGDRALLKAFMNHYEEMGSEKKLLFKC